MEQITFQPQDFVEWDLGAVCQNQKSLIVIDLLHIAGDGDIGAAGLSFIWNEVGYGYLRMVCEAILQKLLLPVQGGTAVL